MPAAPPPPPTYDIPDYLDFIPEPLLNRLWQRAVPVDEIPSLRVAPGLREDFPHLEDADALAFTVQLYRRVRGRLRQLLEQRRVDRDFLDQQTRERVRENDQQGLTITDPDYRTVVGSRDPGGRVVVGPLADPPDVPPVDVPPFLQGEQVTLFGPPDSPKMSINAMNALHRRMPDEAGLVTELVRESGQVPRWGADDEDSKTPIMRNFLAACDNLLRCFDGSLRFEDEARGKRYELAENGLSKPIKRIPGLALPDGSHLLDGSPLPLHLVDFALHLYHNRNRPEALVFYVPKLENEEEAAYFRHLVDVAEGLLNQRFPQAEAGRVRALIVFENPRAIFRIKEMAHALGGVFLGGSLGWHDFLASTARLFREDPNYRIPVKADPDIVIKHIKASHRLLATTLDDSGAIRIGGMYGVLYEAGEPGSLTVSMVGYIRDVVTQLKRGLDGFWVAHPDFVRPGIALVQAWRRHEADPDDGTLAALIRALVPDKSEQDPLLDFVFGEDVPGLDPGQPGYNRALLAANLGVSDVIPNDHPDELRYNVFQALQYLADWLRGNGCVALPATLENARGDKVFVRIMDDLATTERSRWELWAELRHGRVPRELFEQILSEELAFIRGNQRTEDKRVAIRWEGQTARWYPVAARLLHQLVTDP